MIFEFDLFESGLKVCIPIEKISAFRAGDSKGETWIFLDNRHHENDIWPVAIKYSDLKKLIEPWNPIMTVTKNTVTAPKEGDDVRTK